MTTDVLAAIKAIETENPAFPDAFLRFAKRDTIRAARLLSISIELHRDEMVSLLGRIWPDVTAPGAAVDDLLGFPFVQRTARGWRVIPPRASWLANDFAQREPQAFKDAHELLARHEAEHETDSSDEAWFVRGRVAFYMAGVDPAMAVQSFDKAFLDAPVARRTCARLWLTHLVLRQEPLLGEHPRTPLFYRAFLAYVAGRRDEALALFKQIVARDDHDFYAAVSYLFASVIVRDREPTTSMGHAGRAISLALDLHLVETELMARDALVWANVERARVVPGPNQRRAGFSDALADAEKNYNRALSNRDEALILRSRLTRAAVRWLHLSDHRRTVENVDPAVVKDLLEEFHALRDAFIRTSHWEAALRSGNFAAQMLRDVGDHECAVEELEYFEPWFKWIDPGLPVIQRINKTLGSIVAATESRDVEERAVILRDRVHELGIAA